MNMPRIRKLLTRFRSELNQVQKEANWRLGIGKSSVIQARGSRILVYHGICKSHPLKFNTIFLTKDSFETQLKLYKKYFDLVSLDEVFFDHKQGNKFRLSLSFDDGFANNYHYVLPLLEKYEVPASFFITGIRDAGYDMLWNDFLCIAGHYGPETFTWQEEVYEKKQDQRYYSVSSGQRLNENLRLTLFDKKLELMHSLDPTGEFKTRVDKDYWLQMNREQIRKLSSSKWVTIGCHGYYHNDLAKIPFDAVKAELAQSKRFLEQVTGKEVKALAFPYGSYSETVKSIAKEIGFKQLLATELMSPADASDPMLKERFTVNPFISPINQLHANISGSYD
jgi:peptidoglycan/xylan/chitin deacetylase (PgdA/CDA1 family)